MNNEVNKQALRSAIARFLEDTSGAVLVDWIVLTAAVAGIGIAVITTTASGVENAATDLKRCMKIQGNIWTKDNKADYAKRMKRIKKRCGKL